MRMLLIVLTKHQQEEEKTGITVVTQNFATIMEMQQAIALPQVIIDVHAPAVPQNVVLPKLKRLDILQIVIL